MYQLCRPVGHAEVDKTPPHDFGMGRVIFDKENNNRFTTHGGSLSISGGLSCPFPRNLLAQDSLYRQDDDNLVATLEE
jgi:hypothetical protein